MKLCDKLQRILDLELRAGNSVERTAEEAFDKVDLWVGLKKRFRAQYEADGLGTGLKVDYNSDAHYPVGKSYYCAECRHVLFAPLPQWEAARQSAQGM